jgi:hypothetical protein
VYVSPRDSSSDPGAFYTHFCNHVRRLRLEIACSGFHFDPELGCRGPIVYTIMRLNITVLKSHPLWV